MFLGVTTVIFICCAPILFFSLVFFYAKDLDELIVFRTEEFIREHLPDFKETDINTWNQYTEDVQIRPYNDSYSLNEPFQESAFSKAEGHSIDYRILYTPIEIDKQRYVLMSRIPMIENHDLVLMLLSQYAILFLFLSPILVSLLRIMSKRMWKPFYASLSKIENFSLDTDFPPDLEDTNITEFNNLNQILNNLIGNNLKAYKKQKEFIENASHELQTPLAVFQSQLDILIQSPELSQEQLEIIQSLYSVSSRMTRLNKNLLLLARIDNYQFKTTESIDFVQTLYTQLLYLRELSEANGIKMNVEVNNSLTILANKFLIESLINNLVVNAIRHNINEGSIHINIKDKSFEIANTGDPEALNDNKLFQRFSRTSEKRAGNGLGLSIVNQICKLHKWKISYSYQKEQHTFVVRFG